MKLFYRINKVLLYMFIILIPLFTILGNIIYKYNPSNTSIMIYIFMVWSTLVKLK